LLAAAPLRNSTISERYLSVQSGDPQAVRAPLPSAVVEPHREHEQVGPERLADPAHLARPEQLVAARQPGAVAGEAAELDVGLEARAGGDHAENAFPIIVDDRIARKRDPAGGLRALVLGRRVGAGVEVARQRRRRNTARESCDNPQHAT
jgi:hypothetical protein